MPAVSTVEEALLEDPLHNRPHLRRFLGRPSVQFVLGHIQNFCWSVERMFHPDRELFRSHVSEEAWLAADHNRLVELHRQWCECAGSRDEGAKATKVCVIIPSRLGRSKRGSYFFEEAIQSVQAQKDASAVDFDFIIGIDDGVTAPAHTLDARVKFVGSGGRSQVLALNGAIDAVSDDADFVAFLEDDDRWHPAFCSWALSALTAFDFASSNQLEVDEDDNAIRVQDFPTPSGWIMPLRTLKAIGRFDPDFKWHLDNDWLGRLGRSGLSRCHLVECNAPTTTRAADMRQGIVDVLSFGGAHQAVLRHSLETPLVMRAMHAGSGMAAIRRGGAASDQSVAEYKRLIKLYGCLPS